MEQPYRVNALIVNDVGMLPGASAEYTSLTINVQQIKIQAASILLTQPYLFLLRNRTPQESLLTIPEFLERDV